MILAIFVKNFSEQNSGWYVHNASAYNGGEPMDGMLLKRFKLQTHWLALVAALLCLLPAGLFAASFTASLDNTAIVMGDNATLSYEIEGASAEREPSPPPVDGLRYESRGTSQQFSYGTGAASSLKYIYTYAVIPQRAGDFTIPSITLKVGGQSLASQPLKLTVAKPGAPSADAINSGSQLAFMKLTLPKTHVYAGEVVTAELAIYVRDTVQNIGNLQVTAMPADGFTIGKNAPASRRREQVGNYIYNVIPFSLAVTAVREGDFSIGPVTASLVLQLPVSNNRNDPYNDDPFGMFRRVENRPVNLATEQVAVKTLPLPVENAPQNFSGAVGLYTMNVTAGPTNVTAGDPITLRVQISGKGAFDNISLPAQTQGAWQNFKTYTPTAKVDTTDALGIEGAKTFEEIIVPQSADVHELPPITFSFFDPQAQKYQTLTQPAMQLAVKPGGATVVPTIVANQNARDNTPPPAQDIVAIKLRAGTVTSSNVALIDSNVFVATQSLPVLAFVGAAFWRKRKETLANNPRLRRKREVARIVQDGLATLQVRARENNPEEFFATVFHLLQERLGERLDVPATAITESVVEERLRPAGVPEPLLQSLTELFQWCNLARYAPMRTSQELAAVIPKLETALKQAEEIEL